MSDKLLHEQLREYAAEHFIGDFECGNKMIASLRDYEAIALAEEIERQYIPLPRFPDGEPMKVTEVLCDGTLVFEGGGAMPARLVTHREPDSLEKLRDYVEECRQQECGSARDAYSEIADRLTALMERSA